MGEIPTRVTPFLGAMEPYVKEEDSTKEEIGVDEVPGFQAACLPGPTYDAFSDDAFGKAFRQVENWLKDRDLPPARWIAYFYDAPEAPEEEGRSEARIAFEGEAESEGGVVVKREPPRLVARYATLLSEAEDPEAVYERLHDWINDSGYRPAGVYYVREVYDVNPWDADPADVRVEFQVPVEERST